MREGKRRKKRRHVRAVSCISARLAQRRSRLKWNKKVSNWTGKNASHSGNRERHLRQIGHGQLSGPLSFIPERTKDAAFDYRMSQLGRKR